MLKLPLVKSEMSFTVSMATISAKYMVIWNARRLNMPPSKYVRLLSNELQQINTWVHHS